MQKILIIDDEDDIRRLLVEALPAFGFETIEAENGRAGVQLATVYMPDLVLSDVRMEGFDGFAALAAIRYHPLTSTIPVVMMTGQIDEQGRRFAMELGADDYISKPFRIPDLVATMRIQLKKRETIQREAVNRKAAQTKTANLPAEWGEPADRSSVQSEIGLESTADSLVGTLGAPARSAFVQTATFGAKPAPLGTEWLVQDAESVVEAHLRMLDRFHPNLGNTAMRAVALCRAVGQVLGLSDAESQDLVWAAALHDISLIGLEREAVGRWLRDRRKVTEEEYAFIRRHPIESQQMLQGFPAFATAGEIIRAHHENWDGTGYPNGASGESIPWLARLLAVAVCYCSQHTMGTPALKTIKSHAGTMFDPRAVEAVANAASVAKIPKGVREILVNEMKTGHVVAADIYNTTGMVLIRHGREVTDSLFSKLMAINRVTPLDQRVLVYC